MRRRKTRMPARARTARGNRDPPLPDRQGDMDDRNRPPAGGGAGHKAGPAAEAIARCLDSAGNAHPDGRKAMTETPPHDKT